MPAGANAPPNIERRRIRAPRSLPTGRVRKSWSLFHVKHWRGSIVWWSCCLEWQQTRNLIAASTIPNIWTRHIADSLQLLDLAADAKIWVDLGSGGGFPGLVLACALADRAGAKVHLVESTAKKCAFLQAAADDLRLPAAIHCERVENFTRAFPSKPDVVTARALAPLPKLLDLAFPLLKRGAKGLFLKGQDVVSELTARL